MEFTYTEDKIVFDKVLNHLDEFVLDFVEVLDRLEIRYVLVSGYVAILFGRSRATEDVDLIIEELSFEKFNELWNALQEFWCVNVDNVHDAYNMLKTHQLAIRFSYPHTFIPNMEVKFPKTPLDQWTLDERKQVVLNNHKLMIPPLEMQIAFKIRLGSEKDIEDARHLYKVFKEHLSPALLAEYCAKLNIQEKAKEYL
ncbi:MAG: hypothetical protein ACE5FT_00315 [Candidatus Nanoarchaeia archaeon]